MHMQMKSFENAEQNMAALEGQVGFFERHYKDHSAQDILASMINDHFEGRIGLVSSFGAEAVVLLHMVSEINPSLPVLFVNTGKLFPETLAYQKQLTELLGLSDVRILEPEQADILRSDASGDLWKSDTDGCCEVRKVRPLAKGLEPFDAWVSGRKRYQSATRQTLPLFEIDTGKMKINPVVSWDVHKLAEYIRAHDLPRHPLVAKGYPSIGCLPCTSPVKPGEDIRAGRWRGNDKTECGIHFVNGKPQRMEAVG